MHTDIMSAILFCTAAWIVFCVADDRASDSSELAADLMKASGIQMDFEKCLRGLPVVHRGAA